MQVTWITTFGGALLLTGCTATTEPASPSGSGASETRPSAANAGGAPSPEAAEAARAEYDKGLRAFNAEDYASAVAAFERANALAPNFRIHYNIARVREGAGETRGAIAAYERYLEQGGSAVPADRRAQVEGRLAALRAVEGR